MINKGGYINKNMYMLQCVLSMELMVLEGNKESVLPINVDILIFRGLSNEVTNKNK